MAGLGSSVGVEEAAGAEEEEGAEGGGEEGGEIKISTPR